MKKQKFKVGDFALVVTEQTGDNDVIHYYKAGEIVEIIDADAFTNCPRATDGTNQQWIYISDLEKLK